MRLYPAIDVKDGQCVRLKKGLFNEVTVYSERPYEIAKGFEEAGAQFIHTVDLDGALKGHGVNAETIKKICSSVNVPVQMGGGIRTLENIQEVLDLGVYRVIIGTKAVENPDFIKPASHWHDSVRIRSRQYSLYERRMRRMRFLQTYC